MKKSIKGVLVVCIVCLVCYFMPFITVETKVNDQVWRVPFGSQFVEQNDTTIRFKSLRSAYAIAKDAENAMMSYPEIHCYGKTYRYDKNNDVSLKSFEVKDGYPTSFVYHYKKGNFCEGWTEDDEIAFPFGAIENQNIKTTPGKAMKRGWFVVKDGHALNPEVFNKFSMDMKHNVNSFLRVLEIQEGLERMVDIQLLHDEENPVLVKIKDRSGVFEQRYELFADRLEGNTHIVEVYDYENKARMPHVLLTFVESEENRE